MGTADLADELFVSPHINHIKVRVTYQIEPAHAFIVGVVINSVIKNLFAHSELLFESVKIRLVKINIAKSLFERFTDKSRIIVAHTRHKQSVINGFDIPIYLVDFIVSCGDK